MTIPRAAHFGPRPSIRETAGDKARRLLASECVYVILTDSERTVARVRGDTGVWDVERGPHGWTCTCAAPRDCSHIGAVRMVNRGR